MDMKQQQGSGVVMERSGQQQEGDQDASRNMSAAAGAMTLATTVREYRRGNWTLPETMVLIEAKKRVHSERHPADQGLARWRWVEDYCWRAGCRRSQNQCNDRWDNLMRDYKKVRAHEQQQQHAAAPAATSYWAMARADRKERCLPSNLLREIYEAMGEIVESRRRLSCYAGSGSGSGSGVLFLGAPLTTTTNVADIPAMQASPLAQVPPRPFEQGTHCSASESPERKRLRQSLDGQPGSSTPAAASAGIHGGDQHREEPQDEDESSDEEDEDVLGGAIGRCAAILSGALESREAAEERRHRELMAVEERRSVSRQARREAGDQCVAGLAAAVSQLAGSMLALAAKRKGPAAPK